MTKAAKTKGATVTEPIGARVRKARLTRGLSVAELARALANQGHSITPSSISQWEMGRTRPDQNKEVALAQLLKVDLIWLKSGIA